MKRYKESEIDQLVAILKEDGIISVPTDTVYGICARVGSEKAYHKLVEIKKRPSNKTFPVMCCDGQQIRKIAVVDEKVEKLMKAFMPGPITLVLNKKQEAFSYINNRGEEEYHELAVRMAPTEILYELIKKLESPIFMTSANQSGEPICQTLDEIEKNMPTLDGVLEGTLPRGEASTIVDCTKDEFIIQREGPISISQIEKVLKK